ncbi:MAG: right-handed parallel beta-helix repeat-containing protein, partial [Muribaculum sp.]|nr:right-handed parallel beta-helix repeat-containing protein [Muribaculum sp.]
MMRIILLWLVCMAGMTAVGSPRSYTIVVGAECFNSCDTISAPTIEKACDQAALLPDDTVTIDIAEGIYRLCRPISVSAQRKAPLRFVGHGMGRSVMSGACALPPFEMVSPQLWMIRLDGPWATADIQQLYVGGQRAVPARTPNALCPMWRTGRVTQTVVDSVPARRAPRKGLAVQALALNPEAYDALSSLSGPVENVRISFMHAWDMTRRYIDTFDPADSLVYVVGNLMKPWNAIDRESQFMLEGDVSFIDEPGEWCIDRVKGVLYYYPRPGETIGRVTAEVPVLDHIAVIDGCNNVSFEKLSMVYTRYAMPRKGDEPLQAASKTGAAVEVRNASGIVFNDCEIAHTGGYGLWFDRGCHNSLAERCAIEDLGAGGVKIGGIVLPEADSPDMTSQIALMNCIIKSGGREFPTGTGVLLTHASDCSIAHNEIADF